MKGTTTMRTIMLVISLLILAGWKHAAAQGIWPDAVKSESVQAAPISRLIGGLERKLGQNPDDAGGWLLLAQSYQHLGRPDDALRAYLKAKNLGQSNADLEAWLTEQQTSLDDLSVVRSWLAQDAGHE